MLHKPWKDDSSLEAMPMSARCTIPARMPQRPVVVVALQPCNLQWRNRVDCASGRPVVSQFHGLSRQAGKVSRA